jgi:DNA-binding IclR family transcriptional regulator
MTKVLSKAFGILEMVVESSPLPVPLMELAGGLGLNKATCSRLARELVEMGYLEQPVARSGFVVGPRAGAFGMRAHYEEALIAAADAPIRSCAERLRQSVIVAILRQGRRYILVHHNCNPDLHLDFRHLAVADAFNTSTGMLLLAHSGEAEFKAARVLRTESLSQCWTTPDDDVRKDAILKTIRDEGCFVHESTISGYPSAIAFPVFKGGRCVAAVGASMPREQFALQDQRGLLAQEVGAVAKTISARLSTVNSI